MNRTRKWQGYWITSGLPLNNETGLPPAPYLRKTFDCPRKGVKATAFVCGLGWHILYVNGKKADDRELLPVVSKYDSRALYVEYDISDLLVEGRNAIVVFLGNGLYNDISSNAWQFDNAPWRAVPKLLCDIVCDGITVLKSDCSWKSAASPVTMDGMRCGETYDARLEIPGFADPGFDDSAWRSVTQIQPPGGVLTAMEQEPCRIVEWRDPVKIYDVSCKTVTYDFGVNFTGRCEIVLDGPAGTDVRMEYVERIRSNGTADRQVISMFAKKNDFQVERFILDGKGPKTFHSHFCYHGFRYVSIEKETEGPKIISIRAGFIHTDFAKTGSFECSNPILNKLQECTRRSFLSNHTGIPTDCPHREKNGWTGDAQLAFETGCFNFNMEKSSSQFLQTLVDCQRPSGQLPGIAPTGGWGYNWGSGPAWDALLFEYPWRMYQFYGNTENIRLYYEAMIKYMDYCAGMSENDLIWFGLGDWCSFDEFHAAPVKLTSTAYYYYFANLMVKFANLLGKSDDAAKYTELAKRIYNAFQKEFAHGNGMYGNDNPTSLAASLYFGLAENPEQTAENLANIMRARKHIADFGIIGAKTIPRVLADYGYAEDAYRIISQPEYPGWAYWIKAGATSLWESWNGTSSLNHIMFGDISAWMYRYLAGIVDSEQTPGFDSVILAPAFVRDLSFVKASLITKQGQLQVEWKRENNAIVFSAVLPGSMSGELRLADGVKTLKPGENIFTVQG